MLGPVLVPSLGSRAGQPPGTRGTRPFDRRRLKMHAGSAERLDEPAEDDGEGPLPPGTA